MAFFDQSKFEVTKADGVATATYTDETVFKDNTDIPFAQMKKVMDYASEFVGEAAEAAATKATEIMSDDKSIDKVVFNMPYGVSKRGQVNVIANRSQTFRSPADGSEVTKSTLKVAVKDPLTKVGKTKIKELESKMTETLL